MNTKLSHILGVLLVILIIFTNQAYCSTQKEVTDFAYESLVFALLVSIYGEPQMRCVDPPGLIILLGEIDTEEARSTLCKLLELYIGSANGEALTYAVVRQGPKILDDLHRLSSEPAERSLKFRYYILPKSVQIKYLSDEERNRTIKWLIEIIESGKSIEYAL